MRATETDGRSWRWSARATAAYLIPRAAGPARRSRRRAGREIAEEAGFTRLTLLGKIGVLKRLTFDRASWNP